jgi:predicted SAM-dependent methyltransferase
MTNASIALSTRPRTGQREPFFVGVVRLGKALLHAIIGTAAYEEIGRRLPRRSETSRYRATLGPFCIGNGIDIGFGGDPITPTALRMDLPSPYTAVGKLPVQFAGDCRNLYWFADGALDYVYSSHVLEDFPEHETMSILREWTRVLRPGGRLVLLLPDQQRYLAYCRRAGQIGRDGTIGNPHHSIDHFSLLYVKRVARQLGNLKQIAVCESLGPYSFAVVYEKEK